jgi:uncharacterized protein (DUF1800 family)
VKPYLDSRLQVLAQAKSIFLRPEFYSTTAKRGLVRSPIEYMVAVLRGAGLAAADAHPEWWCRNMGQVPFAPPNVAGWGHNAYWISTSAQWARSSFASFVRWKVKDAPLLQDLRERTPEDAVRTALHQFGVLNAGPRTTAALVDYVKRERATDRWAERPNLIYLVMMCPEMGIA